MTAKKRILIITPYPPNNNTAGQSNTNTVIDDFIKKNYSIDLITFSYSNHKIDRPERLGLVKVMNNNRAYKYFYSILLFFFFPFYTNRFSLRVVLYLLKNQKSYNIIYLDYSQVFIYSIFVRKKEKTRLMLHDIIIQRFARANRKKFYKKWLIGFIYRSERFFFRQAFSVMVLSFKDKRVLKNIYKIDADAILPKNRFLITGNMNEGIRLNQFAFLGAWNRFENLQGLEWFIKEVYPALPGKYVFVIIGSGLPSSFLENLPGAFKPVGFIEDTTAYIQQSAALISPVFFGAGIKFKVLDALRCGCRVIGTNIAFEGIEVTQKKIIFNANSPKEFEEAINFCSITKPDPELIKSEFKNYLQQFQTVTDLI